MITGVAETTNDHGRVTKNHFLIIFREEYLLLDTDFSLQTYEMISK